MSTVRVWHPMAPVNRWHLLGPLERDLAQDIARNRIGLQEESDGWYRLNWGTQNVRRGMIPGHRKPWVFLEVRGVERAE